MKGATLLMLDYISLDFISIHAPMKGATPRPWEPRTAMLYFNPRTHEGCDKGTVNYLTGGSYFNPRTHEGCDIQLPGDG